MTLKPLALWLCLGAVAYNYVGYPVLLFLLAMLHQARSDLKFLLRRESRRVSSRRPSYRPHVAILISAFNEEAVIHARVKNALESDYPSALLDILVGLDSPTDSTAEVLSRIQSPRVRVFEFQARRGKLAVLRDLAEQTSAEILILTDAETMFAPDCIRNLVRHFEDDRVGVVGGELRVVGPDGMTPVESLYWRYELILKLLETRLNCVVGVVGAVYAVRRVLFHSQKASFAEDFQLPMELRYSGRKVIYDPEATATEQPAPTFSAEFRRRIRLGAADYQILAKNPHFFNPLKGMPSFAYFSHKVLRWLSPLLLLAAFLFSIALISSPLYAGMLVAQCVFYGSAGLGYWLKRRNKSTRILSPPLYFSAMNLALLLGLIRYLSGRQTMAWEVTPRVTESEKQNSAPMKGHAATQSEN